MNTLIDVRPSPIAGTWYASQPEILCREVDNYLAAAKLPELPGKVLAVVAPHAGYRYSGSVAGYAFACVMGQAPDVVAVLSPMHHLYSAHFLTTSHAAYATPLGEIPVDHQLVDVLDGKLKNKLGYGLTRVSKDPEHSLEIELPFLQRALKPGFTLLPVMLRQQSRLSAQIMGEMLAETLSGKNALIVASTDLSHFHAQSTANILDQAVLEQVEALSPYGIFDLEDSGKGEACGVGGLAAIIWAAKAMGADKCQILCHDTSGRITGDLQSVVGYGAAVIFQTK